MPLVSGADFGLTFPARGGVGDISPITQALTGIIQEKKQAALLQEQEQAKTLQKAFQTTALNLLDVSKKGDITSKRTAIARMAQNAELRGENTQILSDLLKITNNDEMDTAILQIARRAGDADKQLDEALKAQEPAEKFENILNDKGEVIAQRNALTGEEIQTPRETKEVKPLTTIAKAKQDLKNGLIDPSDFNAIKSAPKEFKTEIGKTIADKQLAIDIYGADSEQVKAFNDAIALDAKGEGPKLTDVAGVRKEFTKQSGDFIQMRDAHNKIQSASNTGPGDVSLIFSFMKIIDPGSTVREGEFATAEETAGIPTRITNLYNKALQGDRLGQEQRDSFKREAGNLFNAQLDTQNQLETVFRGLATRQGMNPDDVVLDFVGNPVAPLTSELSAEEQAELDALEAEFGNP